MKAKAKSTRTQKIEWLLQHQPLWEGYPKLEQGWPRQQRELFQAMKQAGLYAANTVWNGCGIVGHINAARRLRRQTRP